MKPRVAIDMDEVIADANAEHAAWYAATFGYQWSVDTLNRTALKTLVSAEHAAAMEARLHQGDVFGTFDVMSGSQDALASLLETFDVFITTAAMEYPASCAAKFAWLRQHFPFIPPLNIVFCGDKSILAANFLIDDNVRHFNRFQGQGILFSAPHNLAVEWPERISGWGEARVVLNGLMPPILE